MLLSIATFYCFALSSAALLDQSHAKRTQTSFPGINVGLINDECTPAQVEVLSRIPLTTEQYLQDAVAASREGWAWMQYFLEVNYNGGGYYNSWLGSTEAAAAYGQIRNSITQASLWATRGHTKGTSRRYQITFRCKDTASNGCSTGKAAYSVPARLTEAGGPEITFCAPFFKQSYVHDLVQNKPSDFTPINSLISFEHLLVHEYMHVRELGHGIDIKDLETTQLPSTFGQKAYVYGASRCKEWAWLNVPYGGRTLDYTDDPSSYNTRSKINLEVAQNADNYAWFATSAFFSKRWRRNIKRQDFDNSYDTTLDTILQVTVDNSSSINDGLVLDGTDESDTTEDVEASNSTSDYPWPQNCHLPNSTDPAGELLCDYIGEEYSVYATENAPVISVVPTKLPIVNSTTATTTASQASMTPAASIPTCGPYDADVDDVQNINLQLDARDGEDCCSNPETGCQSVASSGSVAVDLCADSELCVNCARLANYVAGLISSCQQDMKVGGSQDIVETEGLSVDI